MLHDPFWSLLNDGFCKNFTMFMFDKGAHVDRNSQKVTAWT